MPIKKENNLGKIKISDKAIAALVGAAVSECYGVVGVTSKNITDNITDLLKKDNYAKGVFVVNKNSVLDIDLYLILAHGVRVSEVVKEVQKRVKYSVEKSLNMDVSSVDVHIEGFKVIG